MEVSETQRDSNPLEMITFFFSLFSTVGLSRFGAFSSWRVLVSDFSRVLFADSPEKAIRWCWLGAFCFLLFSLVL